MLSTVHRFLWKSIISYGLIIKERAKWWVSHIFTHLTQKYSWQLLNQQKWDISVWGIWLYLDCTCIDIGSSRMLFHKGGTSFINSTYFFSLNLLFLFNFIFLKILCRKLEYIQCMPKKLGCLSSFLLKLKALTMWWLF